MKKTTIIFSIALFLSTCLSAFDETEYQSGGKISALQAAYDVNYYEIHLKIDPTTKSISGYTDIRVKPLIKNLQKLEIDLISAYEISHIWINNIECEYRRRHHKIIIHIPGAAQGLKTITARIEYSGKPPEAKNPPWDGGFNWSRDASGNPWIGVTCQGEGGKIWWPCKDHPSDEPDSVAMFFTVPKPLVVASNGVLVNISDADEGWHTYHWKTQSPINNYCVTLNVANYIERRRTYHGEKDMDIVFYVLKDAVDGADSLLEQTDNMLKFYAKHFGEFPYIKEKFGLAQSDYLGMEHQTMNSYGNNYVNTNLGYDFLLFHEMAHEWWGNYLTADDWADLWLHEGTAIYVEGLFIEETYGSEEYIKFFLQTVKPKIQNNQAIVPTRNATSSEVYTSDIYFKGAYVLHMLRYLMGKEAMDSLLYRLVQEEKRLPQNHIITDDFIKLVGEYYTKDLQWFYNHYLYSKDIPILNISQIKSDTSVTLTAFWEPKGFQMPLEIELIEEGNSRRERLPVTDQSQIFSFSNAEDIEIDPDNWLLYKTSKDGNSKTTVMWGAGAVTTMLIILLLL